MHEELIARMIEELRHAAPLHLTLGPTHAVQLAYVLSRADKLRDVPTEVRRTIEVVRQHIRLHFADRPAIVDGIDRGVDGLKQPPIDPPKSKT